MITEAIILAGGLGTRLRSAVPDLPKCMAPVSGRPFLDFVIEHLEHQGIDRFVFSLGYMSDTIVDHLRQSHPHLKYQLSIEEEPLGTGGAIRQGLSYTDGKSVIVVNGDTLFKADIIEMYQLHELSGAHCTMALKPMHHFDRYGVVEIDAMGMVQCFREKQYYDEGLINGGVYAIRSNKFLQEKLPQKFSFETDYLQCHYRDRTILGIVQDKYFIDIGIPEDYARAQEELKSGIKGL